MDYLPTSSSLLDLTHDYSAEPLPTVAAARDAVATLDGEVAVLPEEGQDEVLTNLGRFQVEGSVNRRLEDGSLTPEQLAASRTAYDKPDPDHSVVGAVQASQEEGEDLSHLDPDQIKRDRFDAKRATANTYRMAVGYEPTVGAVASGVADTALRMFVTPTLDSDRLANVIATKYPEWGWVAYSNLGEGIRQLRDHWLKDGMTVEQANLEMMDVAQSIRAISETGTHSIGQERGMLDSVFMAVEEAGEEGWFARNGTTLDTIGQQGERIATVPIVGGAIKGAMAIGRGIRSAAQGVGLMRGTYNYTVAQSAAGVDALARRVTGRASKAPVQAVQGAADIADITATIAMPKVRGTDITDHSVPYMLASQVDDATKARLLADPEYVFGSALVNRIHDIKSSDLVDDSISMVATLGGKNGNAFKTQAAARGAITREFPNAGATIVPDGPGRFLIQLPKARQFGLVEAAETAQNNTVRGYGIWNYIGRHVAGTKWGNQSVNIATRQTEMAESALAQVAAPYLKLPHGSQKRVAALLDEADELERVHSIADLRTAGLRDAEIMGYASIRKLADAEAALQDLRLWNKYTTMGWRSLPGMTPGKWTGVKQMDSVADAIYAEKAGSAGAIKAVRNGVATTLDTAQAGEAILRLMTVGKNGERYMLVPKQTLSQLTDLPRTMIPRKAGYLPRPYKYPHYVKVFENNQAVRTLRPARSQNEADEMVADMRAQFPGVDFRAVGAQEFAQVDELSEVRMLEDAGLWWSDSRGPSRLRDASGGLRIPTVEDRIRGLIRDGSMNAGLNRWADAQRKTWTDRFGKHFGKDNPWSPGVNPRSLTPSATASDAELTLARNEAAFINNVLGVGEDALRKTTTGIGRWVAERLYNAAGQGNSRLANATRDLADNFMGASGRLLANAKTLPYLVFLAGNPIRQLPLQMTLIPSYFGLTGAAKYALGGFQRDFSYLMAGGVVEGAKAKLAGKAGSDADLFEQFARSGLMESLEHHTMVATIGTTGTTSSATRFGSYVDDTVKGLTNIGIGAGIKAEKASAWLLSRNRWKEMNPGKKIDKEAEQKIAAFAEELSLNPNRSDMLPIQHGILGLMTQFMAMQVKQTGRTLQALGAPTGSLSRAEAARMAGINLSLYGITGYGAAGLADKIMNSPEMSDYQWARDILGEGLANFTTDTVLSLATGEKVDTDLSKSFSPNAQIGATVQLPFRLAGAIGFFPDYTKRVAEWLSGGDYEDLSQMRWNAPVLGFSNAVIKAADFTASVYGAPELPTPENDAIKLAAIIRKWTSIAPGTNNAFKSLVALELRKKYSTSGDPLVDASVGEAIMALAGVPTKEERAVWELTAITEASGMSEDAAIKSVRDAAYETSQWLLPLLDQWESGQITYAQAALYINATNVAMFTTLSPAYHQAYTTALREAVSKRISTTKWEKLIARVMKDAGSNKLPIDGDAITAIAERIPDEDERQRVVGFLKTRMFGEE